MNEIEKWKDAWGKQREHQLHSGSFKVGHDVPEEWKVSWKKKRFGRPSFRKGKTFEQLYGVERAKELKKRMSLIKKGKTPFGPERYKEIGLKNRKQINVDLNKSCYSRGYIIGTICGDGWLEKNIKKGNHRLYMCSTDIENCEMFQKQVFEWLGWKPNIRVRIRKKTTFFPNGTNPPRKPCGEITVASKNLVEWFEEKFPILFGKKSKIWKLPDWYMNEHKKEENKEELRGFLRAFFDGESTFGNAFKGNYAISCFSSSLEGIKQIQELLNLIGIKTRINNGCHRDGNMIISFNKYEYRMLFYELIGISAKRKFERLEYGLKKYYIEEQNKITNGLSLLEKSLNIDNLINFNKGDDINESKYIYSLQTVESRTPIRTRIIP